MFTVLVIHNISREIVLNKILDKNGHLGHIGGDTSAQNAHVQGNLRVDVAIPFEDDMSIRIQLAKHDV